jgi:tRNA pseudouridine55 synthase
VRLGFATSTDDATGEPLSPPREVVLDDGALREAVASLVGQHDQVPPAFSARHVAGRRLYELARRGEAVAREATPVTVHALELVERDGPVLLLDVRCSPGTYVRAIARDLGERLGTGGHLTELRRTRSGEFSLEQAVGMHELDAARSRMIPLASLLPALPAVRATDEGRRAVSHGRSLGAGELATPFPGPDVERVRVLDSAGELIALAVPGRAAPEAPLSAQPLLRPDLVLLDVRGGR